LPPTSALVVQTAVAWPVSGFQLLATATAVQFAMPLPLSLNATDPDKGTAAPAEAVTVAVNVTESLTFEVLLAADEATAVVLLAFATVTLTSELAPLAA